MSTELPTIIATSVIRSAHQGESHGGIYIVDLQTNEMHQVVDWDDGSIEWEGRGGERGLRGIVCLEDTTYVASNDAIYGYDECFNVIGKWTNRYLDHSHEIYYDSGTIYVTSTKFDAILSFDTEQNEFTTSFCIRDLASPSSNPSLTNRVINHVKDALGMQSSLEPTFTPFDPTNENGPSPYDMFHLNSVAVRDGAVFFSGTKLPGLYAVENGHLREVADIPKGTHNAQPFQDYVLYNNTSEEEACLARQNGTVMSRASIKRYREKEIRNSDLPDDHARQAFGRGLCTYRDEYVIAGSSPATITVYSLPDLGVVKRVNISMDKRNAIHGLEIFSHN